MFIELWSGMVRCVHNVVVFLSLQFALGCEGLQLCTVSLSCSASRQQQLQGCIWYLASMLRVFTYLYLLNPKESCILSLNLFKCLSKI